MDNNLLMIFELLRADGSIIVNKKLARGIGLQPGIVYSELISKYLYFSKRGELKDGYFFNTIENLEKDTTLSVYQQRNAIVSLVKRGFITQKIQGIPAKRYFKILVNKEIFKKLSKIMLKEIPPKTSLRETHKLDSEKLTNSINNTKDNTKTKNLFFREAEKILNYLNQKTGKSFKPLKQTVDLISARIIKEGRTFEDFKKVIDKKTYDWLRDYKMIDFLRPSTLFERVKFENYLNELEPPDPFMDDDIPGLDRQKVDERSPEEIKATKLRQDEMSRETRERLEKMRIIKESEKVKVVS